MKKLPNIHPGDVLLEAFLKPLDISQNRLAGATGQTDQDLQIK